MDSERMVWAHNSFYHVYYMPPLSYWTMAALFWITGNGGQMMTRIHTIMWGCVLLVGMYQMCRKHGAMAGIWATLFAAINFHFLGTSDGRPDMMCAALGVWALVLNTHWLASAAALVHPVGLVYTAILFMWNRKFDWLPYAVGLAVWGLYIVQAPAVWLDQWGHNIFNHATQIQQTKGLAVYMGFGVGWRLLILLAYVVCGARVALRDIKWAWWLGAIVLSTWFMTRSINYAPHFVAVFSCVMARDMVQWGRWKWLMGVVVALEVAFAYTTLIPLWTWNGVFHLR